jgi:hypothetical protein
MNGEKIHFTCYKCPDRSVGCHSKCEKYQAEKAEWQKLADARAEKNKRLSQIADYHCKSVLKHRKRKREKS